MSEQQPFPEHWLLRLARELGVPSIPGDLAERLAGLQSAVAGLTDAQREDLAALKALQEAVDRMERQVNREGKEQFKANALAETQQRQMAGMLERLSEAETRRERELAALREQLGQARHEGRVDIIKSVLPVLDGLDEAIASGGNLLRHAEAAVSTLPRRPGLAARFRAAARLVVASEVPVRSDEPVLIRAVSAWLEGLMLVRNRLLAILSEERVYPIDTVGAAFDPHRHVAVEAVTASDGMAPDTIVRETRRGYTMDGAVLRYAEVVVARAPSLQSPHFQG